MPIKNVDIVVGIPTLNEAATISDVTQRVDQGLQEFFPELQATIVNADNRSTDRTKEAFLTTRTKTEKVYLPTPANVVGKGKNLRNLLNYAAMRKATAVATFDGDLQSIRPSWVRDMIAPVLVSNFDFAYPVYERHRFDGTTTNLICYPIVYGVFCSDVRQPIAGDFAFSGRFVDHLIALTWPNTSLGFGVDILVSTEAIVGEMNVCGVQLGQKIHRRKERSTLGRLAIEVLDTLIRQIKKHRLTLEDGRRLRQHPIVSVDQVRRRCPLVPIDRKLLAQQFLEGSAKHLAIYQLSLAPPLYHHLKKALDEQRVPEIDYERWCDIVYRLIGSAVSSRQSCAAVAMGLVPLYFARMLTFAKTVAPMDDLEFETYVRSQAEYFFTHRQKLGLQS